MHLLIVEECAEERESIALRLRRHWDDLRLTEVWNADIFRQALEQGSFDLVLTDYQLSWTNGLQLLRQVKARFPDVPVVMFTASGSEEVAAEGMRAGLSTYLLKKHAERLPAVIQSSLEQARLQRELDHSLIKLQQSRDELEQRVEERTAELVRANEKLSAEIAERRQAELALESERRRLQDVLERLPAYVALLSPDYHVTFANHFFRERFGESHGRRCFEYLFERSEPCESCETFKTLSAGRPQHWEWTGPDGRTYDINDLPFADIDGSPLILEMGTDITKRKEAEEALHKAHNMLELHVQERTAELTEANERLREQTEELQQQQEELETQAEELRQQADELLAGEQELRETRDYLDNLLTYANAPIIVWDPDLHITRFNGAFERLTGYRGQDVLGRPLDLLFPADRRDEAMAYIRRALAGERLEVVEIPIRRVDGTVRTVLWNSATLYAADGTTVVATIAQGQDITGRKQVEEALRENEQRFALLSEANALLLSSQDPESTIQSIAEQVMRHLDCDVFFNYVLDEARGRLYLNAYAGISAEAAQEIHELEQGQAICGCAARDGHRVVSEDIQHNGDARADLVRAMGVQAYAAHPLRIGDRTVGDRTVGTLSFGTKSRTSFTEDELALMRTVADQVSVAIERKRAENALRESAETKATLLREVNHRVKNNLGAIIGLLYTQMDRPGTAALPEYQEALNEVTRRIEGLSVVHGLLSKSQWAPLRLDELAEKVIGVTLRSAPAGQVNVQISPSPVCVSPDQAHTLALVLNELALNVGKHAANGAPVQVTLQTVQEDGQVVLTVCDNGPGYPEEVLEKQRSGVGLELLRNMVARNLRGQLSLRNKAGAVTEIRFPVVVKGKVSL